MALRFSRVLGRSADRWLSLQDSQNLWQVRQRLDSVDTHSDGAHAGMKGLLTGPAGQREQVLLASRPEGMELILTSRSGGGAGAGEEAVEQLLLGGGRAAAGAGR